ncbi:MAG TPA: DUF1648 domain-containing protein [Actinomycetales bacterium]|nr:DUF1648 domain-containing protein [Actinomycetales bacterium]
MTTTRDTAATARGLPREPTARWILVLAAVVTAAWLAVLAWQVAVLPEQVPTGFGPGGEVRGWGGRAEVLAFSVLLPLVAAFPLPLLSRLALSYPSAINAPNREWWTATPPRLRRFERLLREDLWLIAVLLLVLFTVIQVETTRAAHSADGSGSMAVIGGVLVVFLVLNTVILARMFGGRYAEQPDLG